MTHGVGAVLSLIGTFIVTNLTKEKISLISGLIFCISLFLLYTASAIYHGLPKRCKLKRIMRVIDHCNVFILEAGTFTPVCLIALSDKIGIVYFYIIWLITIIGIVNKITKKNFLYIILLFYPLVFRRKYSPSTLDQNFHSGDSHTQKRAFSSDFAARKP